MRMQFIHAIILSFDLYACDSEISIQRAETPPYSALSPYETLASSFFIVGYMH